MNIFINLFCEDSQVYVLNSVPGRRRWRRWSFAEVLDDLQLVLPLRVVVGDHGVAPAAALAEHEPVLAPVDLVPPLPGEE